MQIFHSQMEHILRQRAAQMGVEMDEEAALTLSSIGTSIMRSVFQNTEQVSDQLSSAIQIAKPSHIQTQDLVKPLWPWKEWAQSAVYTNPPQAYVLRAAGDGNCLLTSLRMGIDLRSSVGLALQCLEDGSTADDLDVEPCLSGDVGSPNHLENFVLRKLLVNWFISPLSNLDLEVAGSDITYEIGNEFKKRPMTRADIIVLETRFHTQGDIDMSPEPEARTKRNTLAEHYMRRMYVNGECGSTPMLIAFVHLSKVPCGVKIYQRQGRGLKSYAEVCSPGYGGIPPDSEDDILRVDDLIRRDVDAMATDACVWEPESESESESDSGPESESEGSGSETEIGIDMRTVPAQDQNFIRLLFSSPRGMSTAAGHYDLLASSFQKNIITNIFPQTLGEFTAL